MYLGQDCIKKNKDILCEHAPPQEGSPIIYLPIVLQIVEVEKITQKRRTGNLSLTDKNNLRPCMILQGFRNTAGRKRNEVPVCRHV